MFSEKEILEKYPCDELDIAALYKCPCGHSSFKIVRSFQVDSAVLLFLLEGKCNHCWRPYKDFKLVLGNYERRLRALEEREQELKATWKPLTPKELLDFIKGKK